MIINSLKIAVLSSLLVLFIIFPSHSAATPHIEQQDLDMNDATLDEQFAALSIQLPGFAGAYFDEDKNFVIVVSKDSEHKQPESIIQALLDSETNKKLPVLDDLQKFTSEHDLIVQEATYDFASLHKWHMAIANEILSDPNVIFIDTNEKENRVVIGIKEINERKKFLADLSALNIPHDAVTIKKTEPVIGLLRNIRRPTGNGLQTVSAGTQVCTLGINVRYWDINHWTNAFLTNAHCTNNQHQVTGTTFSQPFGLHRIGIEIDTAPEIFTNCPSGRRCYYVDGALVEYNPGVQLQGKISRTAYWDQTCASTSNDCPIDTQNPSFPISGTNRRQYHGQIVNKVGRSTGWTDGMVHGTCMTVNDFSTPDITLLCQNRVLRTANAPLPLTPIASSGDSGSPVFKIINSNAVIAGLVWGAAPIGNAWFYAPWGNVRSGSKGISRIYVIPWNNGAIRQN